jgi:hypothetical protein
VSESWMRFVLTGTNKAELTPTFKSLDKNRRSSNGKSEIKFNFQGFLISSTKLCQRTVERWFWSSEFLHFQSWLISLLPSCSWPYHEEEAKEKSCLLTNSFLSPKIIQRPTHRKSLK